MIDRNRIEKILKINGLSSSSPEEEIRSILISARWQEDDVETALTVLRENKVTGASRVDTLHNVFLTDRRLSPEAIEALLGIEVEMTSNDLNSLKVSRNSYSITQLFIIVVLGTVLAAVMVFGTMYINGFGFFH